MEHLPILNCQICSRSPIAHNLYILKNQINIHLDTTFSLVHLLLHKNCTKVLLTQHSPHTQSSNYKEFLKKFATFNIIALPQIQFTPLTYFLCIIKLKNHHHPFPSSITNIHFLRYPDAQSYYIEYSFKSLDNQGNENIAGVGVSNGPLQIHIAAKLLIYPNILKVELYALLLTIEHTKRNTPNTFVLAYTYY